MAKRLAVSALFRNLAIDLHGWDRASPSGSSCSGPSPIGPGPSIWKPWRKGWVRSLDAETGLTPPEAGKASGHPAPVGGAVPASRDRVLSLRVGEATLILSADADEKGYIAEELTLDQLQRRNLAQNIELRRRFASYLLSIHSAVNAAVLVLVFLIALNKATLSERVIITLIASTVAELAGLVLAVATYLFPAPKVRAAASGVPIEKKTG